MDARSRLDAELGAVVDALPMPDLTPEVVRFIRGVQQAAPVSDAIELTEHEVPGDPPLVARVYRPAGAEDPLPGLYWIHGGGYVLGAASEANAVFAELGPELGVVGVSVEYRLAPEHPYPAAIEDCYRGLQWTVAHADALGIDAGRTGIMGISAGGGLAAALAIVARDRGGPAIAYALLDCPMLDDRQITESSQLDGLSLWSKGSNEFGWRAYLADRHGTGDVPSSAAAAREHDLVGLPPTFVSVGAVDGFVDEDVDYAMRLNRAGVATELHVYPGACHGYHIAADWEVTAQSRRDMVDWLRRQLARTAPTSR
jgi:acetyl esterase/lipase